MMSGQSINDRITAARYSIAGQGLAKSVCKATTEEVIGPKKKHLDYLLHCTNEPNVSIPQLANLLIERTNQASWVIVFKALVTVHHLMCYGNERFTQYLASSNCHFQLSGFLDKTGVQGYDMSTFIRRYAKYLNEKALSYRTVAFDFCKVKRGKEEGVLRSMNAEKLVKTVPILQNQLDALLEFDCTANELTNGVINTAFMLLFRDLIRLFACYNDGIINLLEKYFDMNKKMCRDALDIYKKFLIRMDRVAEFLKVAENVGIDKGDIPDLTKAPGSLLDALEQHLAALEGKKGPGGATTPTGSTSNAFGTAAAAQVGFRQGEVNGVGVDESMRKIALEEEQAALNNHKERKFKELGLQSPTSGSTAANTNPFLSSPTPVAPGEDAVNLFGSPTASVPSGGGKASDDLLCLAGNPFADERAASSSIVMAQAHHQQHFWGGAQNGLGSSVTPNSTFVPETSFSAVFGSTASTQASLGVAKPLGAAPEVTVDTDLDLTIPGLNPFANLSSNTPSPLLGPPELAGAGTTPILGGHSGFGFAFGGGGGPADTCEKPMMDNNAAPFADFEAGFGHHAPPRPPSPYVAPASVASSHAFSSMDARDFAFGAPSTKVPSPSPTPAPAPSPAFTTPQGGAVGGGGGGSAAFDFSAVPESTGPGSPAHSHQGFSAFDDLNTTIRAALNLSGSGGGGGSQAASPCRGPAIAADGSPRSRSLTPALVPSGGGGGVPAVHSLAQASSSSSSNSSFSFGSPSKSANAPATAAAVGKGFDAFGDILQPMPTMATASSGNMQAQAPQTGGSKSQSKVITGDLDSSLASLVQNLEINRGAPIAQKGPHVWNSPKNMAKTGGANWTPHVAGSTAGAGPWNSPQHNYQPMAGARPATMGPIPQQNVMAPMFGVPANAGPRPAAQQQRAMDPFGNL